jgi:hypothetical protein
MRRSGMLSALVLLGVVVLPATAGALTIPPCNLNLLFGTSANACDVVSGFGTTTISAGVAAIGGAGTASGAVTVLGTTDGPVRPGYIQISALSDISFTGLGSADLVMAVAGYNCAIDMDVGPCQIWGSYSPTDFLPFTLGAPFQIGLDALVSVSSNPYASAFASGAIQFSVFEQVTEPTGYVMPGQAAEIFDPSPTPADAAAEPGTCTAVGLVLFLAIALIVTSAWFNSRSVTV